MIPSIGHSACSCRPTQRGGIERSADRARDGDVRKASVGNKVEIEVGNGTLITGCVAPPLLDNDREHSRARQRSSGQRANG